MDKLQIILGSFEPIFNKYTDTVESIVSNSTVSVDQKLDSIKIQTEISNFELNRLIINSKDFLRNQVISTELIRYLKFFKKTLPSHNSNRDSIISEFKGSTSSSETSQSSDEYSPIKIFMNDNFERFINLDENVNAKFIFNFRVKIDQKINFLRTHDLNIDSSEMTGFLENIDSSIDENGLVCIIPLFKLSKFYLNFIKINKHFIFFQISIFIVIFFNNFDFYSTSNVLINYYNILAIIIGLMIPI